MKKQVGLFLVLALFFQAWNPAVSFSGGESFAVEIDRIERHGFGSYTLSFRLSKVDGRNPFGECEIVTIEGEYSFLRWLVLFLSKPDVLSWEGHQVALAKLETSRQRQISVRFGQMGAGLKKQEGSSCVWESRGLSVLTEANAEEAVYSFYKWP